MNVDRLKDLVKRNPFVPFQIRLTDGRSLRVTLPGQLRPGPEWRWVWLPMNGEVPDRLDLAAVEAIIEESACEPHLADRSEKGVAMTTEKFDEFLKRRPFVPFVVYTADGGQFAVKSPEFASRTQQGRTIFVSTGGEQTECIDLLLVTRLSAGLENSSAQQM